MRNAFWGQIKVTFCFHNFYALKYLCVHVLSACINIYRCCLFSVWGSNGYFFVVLNLTSANNLKRQFWLIFRPTHAVCVYFSVVEIKNCVEEVLLSRNCFIDKWLEALGSALKWSQRAIVSLCLQRLSVCPFMYENVHVIKVAVDWNCFFIEKNGQFKIQIQIKQEIIWARENSSKAPQTTL